ncbi:MAG: SIMPL domain-containing protein [Acidaminococcus sp.]|uniref:SIMPL domain-containing protein n=1 Tax=Acidaminococcus TaxID=904 RepID=UPI002666DBD5|nr:SIMPL domain-containing protein [Acidaminococcus sp.]MDO5598271.1 SIMPL domain-containing protein [Acidaminococcus sp.]
MKKIGAIFAAAALALSLHATPALADQPLDTIQITGTASRTVDPDMATVNFAFEKQGATLEEVRQSGADASTRFINSMLGQGISRSDIATTGYNISPRYTYERNGARKLNGYQVNANWSVKVRNLDKLGTLIDKGLTSANRMDNVKFGLQNEDLIKRQLLSQAVENAKYTAAAVANAGGRGLGVLRQASIPSTSVVQVQPLMMAKLAGANAAEDATETELAPTALTVTVRVDTLFALTLE